MWKFKDFLLFFCFFFLFVKWFFFFFVFPIIKCTFLTTRCLLKRESVHALHCSFFSRHHGLKFSCIFSNFTPQLDPYIFLPWIFFWIRKLFDLNNEFHSYTCERQVSKWALLFRIYLAFTTVSCKVDHQSSMHEFIAVRKETLWIVKPNQGGWFAWYAP